MKILILLLGILLFSSCISTELTTRTRTFYYNPYPYYPYQYYPRTYPYDYNRFYNPPKVYHSKPATKPKPKSNTYYGPRKSKGGTTIPSKKPKTIIKRPK